MSVDSLLDRSEELLQVLTDTFGEDDRRIKHIWDVYKKLTGSSGESEIPYRLAVSYLEWCVAYPARIGVTKKLQDCRMGCVQGWVKVDDASYRPCPNCLPGAHDQWAKDFEQRPDGEDGDGMF